jgi:gliding motility-associated lipoprotein GldB
MKRLVYIFLSLLIVTSCTFDNERKVDVSNIQIDVKIDRLEQEMMQLKSKEAIKVFLNKNPGLKHNFLKNQEFPHDSLLVNEIYKLIKNPGIQKLYKETEQTFGDGSGLRQEFADAFKHMKYYYPGFKAPQVETVITGLGSISQGNDLFISDSLVIVSLDFYIGDNASYVPDVPQYVQRRFRKEYIVPSVVLLMSQKYNKTSPTDNTLLGEMIFYGKAFEFTRQVLPSVHDSLIVGYSGKQLQDTQRNTDIIWSHFVEKKLLYQTSHFEKVKYIGDRPFTAEIGKDCPGAIARWLGWEIVKKYRKENPAVTLPQLMKDPQAQGIFAKSKYKGA